MNMKYALAVVATLVAGPILAAGDPAVGEKEFSKCKSCHSIVAADGTAIVKGGKVGPNLYGVVGRPLAGLEGFKYSKSLVEAGEKGLVWSEEEIATYLKDPTAYLKNATGNSKAKSGMNFKLAKKSEDVAAYLASVAN